MSEKIIAIREFEGYAPDVEPHKTYGGWLVITNKQIVRFMIDDRPNCCESFGWITTNDDPQYFVGSRLRDVKVVDEALNVHEELPEDTDAFAIFLNIETDIGTLQFAVYNEHNGYYGHAVKIRSTQLCEDTSI
jgi:hypothetical protein